MTYTEAFEIASDQRFRFIPQAIVETAQRILRQERAQVPNHSAIAFRLDQALGWLG
jgi:hypothetical protein